VNLLGQYEVSVGDKGRIALPSKVRKELGEKVIITYGFEKSLIVVSEQNWTRLVGELKNSSLFAVNARDTKRFLFGGAISVTLDKQGRFLLPEYLRKYAGIGDEVIFLGLESYAELWDKKQWNNHTRTLQGEIEKIAETLIKKIEE
jgi:MraZ protein